MARRKGSVRRKEEDERWRRERRWRNRCGAEGGHEVKGNKKIFKATFLNVARLKNKDSEFWEGLKDWDLLILSET